MQWELVGDRVLFIAVSITEQLVQDSSGALLWAPHPSTKQISFNSPKKRFFAAAIASAQSHPAELFWVVRGLVHAPTKEQNIDHSTTRCEEIAHFADKVTRIRYDLDAVIDTDPVDVTLAPACPVLMDTFQLVQPDAVSYTHLTLPTKA